MIFKQQKVEQVYMKEKIIALYITLTLSLTTACAITPSVDNQNDVTSVSSEGVAVTESGVSTEKEASLYMLSNLLDEESRQKVEAALAAVLSPENVRAFMNQVNIYNTDVQGASLHAGFQSLPMQDYDIHKLSTFWEEKHPENPGTNCRINSFLLLQDDLTIGEGPADATLLFIDRDSIRQGKLFKEEQFRAFERLFSQVDTVATKDANIHAQKMEEHLQSIIFPEKAAMISLVTHDNLDGDKLFIGHVGVLVPLNDKVLFVEKLSFVEPYQAIIFANEEEVYDYMLAKFGHYYAEDTAKPFVMKNSKAVRFS